MIRDKLVTAIVLASRLNFGRFSIKSQLQTALWPVGEEPVLQRLLIHLARQGITKVVVCSNGDDSVIQRLSHLKINSSLKLKFLDEPLPLGTAGCIRKVAEDEGGQLFVVFTAAIVSPPEIDLLLRAHNNGKSHLTAFFNPSRNGDKRYGKPVEIYVCDRSIVKYIPTDGYFDIKQGLIPALISDGETVRAVALPKDAGNFSDWQGYLYAVSDYLQQTKNPGATLKLAKYNHDKAVWKGINVNISPAARIFGHVVILNEASVSDGVVIIGPSVIGRNVRIGNNSVIMNSIIWDNVRIEQNCLISNCVVDQGAFLIPNTTVQEEAVSARPVGWLRSSFALGYRFIRNIAPAIENAVQNQQRRLSSLLPNSVLPRIGSALSIFAVIILLLSFFWSYQSGIESLWNVWKRSDEYSSGLLVPFLALYVLWSRRHEIADCDVQYSMWGVLLLLFAQAVRFFGLFFMYGSLERLSIVLSVAALVLLFCGWKFFKKVATILLFLCLMLPWPNRIQAAVALPLQRWATSSAVFCLELIGYEVIQEGNIIHIGNTSVAVAEACNGLRMITAFFVVGALVVLLVRRSWWEKLVVLISCLPIALLCNTIRLTLTAIAFTVVSGDYWEKIFHDYGGYAMMPLALGAVVAELWLLSELITAPSEKNIIILKRG